MDILTAIFEYYPRLGEHKDSSPAEMALLYITRQEMFLFAHQLFGKYEVNLSLVPAAPPEPFIQIKDVVAWIEFSLL